MTYLMLGVQGMWHEFGMSVRKEAYRKSKDSPLELVSYKFFIIPKEVHNMANRLKIGSDMTKVDWSLMMQDHSY